MNKDLTVGKPEKVLVKFTLPLFISVIFQQLYNIADSVIAGKYAGENALAAVGASYPITMIFMAVAIGSQIGCSVVISRFFGAKDYKNTKICISTTLISGFVLSIFLILIGILFSSQLMRIINTPDNIFAEGNLYLRIYTAGFVFLYIYNITTGIFNSLGDSKTPLYFLIASSIGNIALDALFVIVFKWGVAGVAWATFIAQGIACVFSVIILRRRVLKIPSEEKIKRFSMNALKNISKVAVPSILQQSFVSVGNMFIQCFVNGFGSSVIAGYSAAIKLNTFAVTSFVTLGNGISSFTAQNLGAKKPERIRKGFRSGLVFALIVALIFFGVFFVCGKALLMLFMNEESTKLAIDTGVNFLKIVSPFYFAVCTKLVCDGVLRGSEKMTYFMTSTFTDLVLRVVFAYAFSRLWAQAGIWYAWPISWIIAAILSCLFYKKTIYTKSDS